MGLKLYQRAVFIGEVKEVKVNSFNGASKFVFTDGRTLTIPEQGLEFVEKYELAGNPYEDAPEEPAEQSPVEADPAVAEPSTGEPEFPKDGAGEPEAPKGDAGEPEVTAGEPGNPEQEGA